MSRFDAEVCVIGGGPAGSTVARRLADMGHEVVLAEASRFPRRHIGESLAPSILPVLDALGLSADVAFAGFIRPANTHVLWSSAGAVVQPIGPEAGFHIDRGRFDGMLLSRAARAGVRVLQPARAGRPTRASDGCWDIPVRRGSESTALRVRAWVDASGRHAGRRGWPRTLATWGYWRGVSTGDTAARIEAARDGWLWGVPLPDGSFNAAVFTDPRAGAARRYRDELLSSTLLRHCLSGEMDGPVQACDVTSYAHEDPIGPGYLRVGEASYAIDPLSSQGVQHALNSAIQGSVVLHAMLLSPADRGAASEFYRDTQMSAVAAAARTAARIYAREDRFAGERFWQQRAAADPGDDRGTVPDEALRDDQRVRLSPRASISETAVVIGDRIRRMPALHHPSLDRPVAFLGSTALAPLVSSMRGAQTASDFTRRWAVPPTDARRVMAWLWHTGLIEAAPSVETAQEER